jgi:PST family polysaccharide transporter
MTTDVDPLALMRRGTRVVAAAQMASQLISLAMLFGLYRLIDPADFGLMGMILPLAVFLRLFTSLGLNVASVQKQGISDREVSSLFWLNLSFGLGTTIVTAALAPALAWFYHEPDLTLLTLGIAGVSLVAAVGSQHQAMLERKLRLGRLAVSRLAGQAAGGAAAIAAGALGWGVWALIVQQYVELGVLSALAWTFETWRPQSPRRSQHVGPLLAFGGYYTLSTVMFYLVTNVDKVVVGYLNQSPRPLGLYSQAFNLMMRPGYMVTTPLPGVMLPTLSQAAQDHERFERLLLAFFRLVPILLLPAGIGLTLVADQAMLVLGGPQWADAGLLLAALAPAILVQGFINVSGSVLASVGRADRLCLATTAMAAVLCPGYVAGWYLGRATLHSELGATLGVAGAYSLLNLAVIFGPYMLFCLRTVRVPARACCAVLVRPAAAAAGMGLVVGICRIALAHIGFPTAPALALEVALGAATYLLLDRADVRWLLGKQDPP